MSNMAIEYQRVQNKKFDFSLVHESEAGSPGTEVPVRIYLKQNGGTDAYLGFDDIVMVQYQLDPSFKSRTIASKDSSNRFEIRIWAHGNFGLAVTILLKAGRTESIMGDIDLSKPLGEIRIAR